MKDAEILAKAFAMGNSDLIAGALLVTAVLMHAHTLYAFACLRACVCICARACVLVCARYEAI